MDDEDIYLEANNELETDNKKQALWIKALAVVGGDEEKAKHQYILLRVEQLKKEKNPTESEGNTHSSGQAIYKSIYFASFIIGISLASYIYLIKFDNISKIVRFCFFSRYSYKEKWIVTGNRRSD